MRALFLTSLLLCIVLVFAMQAHTQTILHAFTGRNGDGSQPGAGVILDSAGNLYGTTIVGGYGCGTVFELSPSGSGWTETVLYSFTDGDAGCNPAAPVFMDEVGNLYGTTRSGGSNGQGVVFKLHRGATRWHETVLHTFGGNDGDPPSGMFVNNKGRAFGTTQYGGAHFAGTVWAMEYSQGIWQYETVYSFSYGQGASNPQSGVIVDNDNHIYGTSQYGGSGNGVAFELTYSPSGWAEKVLWAFQGGSDGADPVAGLVLDGSGNLYGSTTTGGTNNSGTVFELSPSSNGWTKTIIYDVASSGALTFDQSGNLFGVNALTGDNFVFELSPSDSGWNETFVFHLTEVGDANGGLVFDPAGNICGTGAAGGLDNLGAVYEIVR